jgi:dienelactone hydrolase
MAGLRPYVVVSILALVAAWVMPGGFAREAGAVETPPKPDTRKIALRSAKPSTPTLTAAQPAREKGSQPPPATAFTLPEDWFWGDPVELQTADGVVLRGVFKAPRPPQTTMILFVSDDQNTFFKAYRPLIARLAGKGYGILALDTRGVGVSQTTADGNPYDIKAHVTNFATYAAMVDDVKQMVAYLRKTKGVGPLRTVLVGSIVGANVAILAAADLPMDVRAVIALSPASNYRYLRPLDAAQNLGGRPLLAIASGGDNDAYGFIQDLKRKATSAEALPIGGVGRGHTLLDPDTLERVLKWVDAH